VYDLPMEEKAITKTLIPKSDELIESMGRVSKLNTKFNERKYTVGDTDLSYRVISHWRNSHILPEGVKNTKGWHKFSFTELIWLKAVFHLRNFGFSLKKIAQIRKQVMMFDKKNDAYPMFELYLVKAWYTDDNPQIVVLADGTADIGDAFDIELVKNRKQQDMLLIPIKSILEEAGIATKRAKFMMPINPDEAITLLAMSSENNKEIIIRKSKGKIKEIETVEDYSENPPLSEISNDFKNNADFGEVITKYENGKQQSAQVRKRKRLR
jgi:DNA-binding transcriptional MerR regulator